MSSTDQDYLQLLDKAANIYQIFSFVLSKLAWKEQYSPETHCPWTVKAELHISHFPHCMESQVSLLSLAPSLGVSKGTLGLHILKCCSFNSQDTFCCTKFLLIIQVAFEEEFHLLWCQAQVYDPLKDVSERNQSDSNHSVCDSTQYKPVSCLLTKSRKSRKTFRGSCCKVLVLEERDSCQLAKISNQRPSSCLQNSKAAGQLKQRPRHHTGPWIH